MKEKTIVSTVTLASSLLMYFYAKSIEKETAPYVMVGGFMGVIIGENIVEFINKNKKG